MKGRLGAMLVAAALTFAGAATSTSASAAPANAPRTVTNEDFVAQRAATATDMSAQRRYYRRYRYVRPYYRPYPYYGYRPRPYYYRPYYRPYYNPYPYYRPSYGYGGPFFSFGFGPRYYW